MVVSGRTIEVCLGKNGPRRKGALAKIRSPDVTMRKFAFTVLLILFALAVWYGVAMGDFLETLSNGVTICLTCIGVA